MDPVQLLSNIETAVLQKLEAGNFDVRTRNVTDNVNPLSGPSANIALYGGKVTKLDKTTFRFDMQFFLTLVFPSRKNEEDRRRGVNPLIMAALFTLSGWRPVVTEGAVENDLDCAQITPGTVRKIADEDGYIAFAIELKTAYEYQAISEDDGEALLKLVMSYYLEPDDGDIDAADTIDLQQ